MEAKEKGFKKGAQSAIMGVLLRKPSLGIMKRPGEKEESDSTFPTPLSVSQILSQSDRGRSLHRGDKLKPRSQFDEREMMASYHGRITREVAERLLHQDVTSAEETDCSSDLRLKENGTFLLRESNTNDNCYVITAVCEDKGNNKIFPITATATLNLLSSQSLSGKVEDDGVGRRLLSPRGSFDHLSNLIRSCKEILDQVPLSSPLHYPISPQGTPSLSFHSPPTYRFVVAGCGCNSAQRFSGDSRSRK